MRAGPGGTTTQAWSWAFATSCSQGRRAVPPRHHHLGRPREVRRHHQAADEAVEEGPRRTPQGAPRGPGARARDPPPGQG
eukprot:6134198-Pyramimonas_sp.AAC.1